MTVTLTSSGEGGTSGTTVTTGNSGGSSGNAFDSVTIGTGAALTFDNAQAAHGSVALKFTEPASSVQVIVQWTTSLTGSSIPAVYFRAYAYFTAFPPSTLRIISALSSGAFCGGVAIQTGTGKLLTLNAAGNIQTTSTSAIPLNAWFRLEGFVTGSATTGQVQVSLYTTPDSTTAAETNTSAANLNTTGAVNGIRFGSPTNGTSYSFWLDDLAASDTALPGPALQNITGADAAAGADTATVAAAVSGADTAAAADTAASAVAISATDTGTGADTAAMSAAVTDADTATSADTASANLHFPATWLDVRAELGLGTWTDITPYVFGRAGEITVGRGHPDETTATNPSSCKLRADNPGGIFSPYNPAGPWYGLIGRNTQLRISTPEGASYLCCETDQASYASCPDSAALSITGDTEIQLDVTLDTWSANQVLAGKWLAAGNQRSWALELNEAGTLTFWWSPDGTALLSATSAQPVPVPALRRQGLRVTLAAGAGTVTFWTAPAAAGQVTLGPVTAGWTQLGAPVVTGATSVADSAAPLTAGYVVSAPFGFPGIYGKVHRLALLAGIGGPAVASPDFTAQAAGTTSFPDAQANQWTLTGTAEISDRKYRGHFEVPAWPPAQDLTGTDVQATIAASGILRRLAQGNSPVSSAIYRYWTTLAGSGQPVAYWSCEDLAGATQLASATGGPPMAISGSPSLASYAGLACSAPLPAVGSSTWVGVVPSYPATGTLVLRFLAAIPGGGLPPLTTLAQADTSGPLGSVGVVYTTAAGGTLALADSRSDAFTGLTGMNGFAGIISVELVNSGSNMNWALNALAPGGSTVQSVSGTLTGVYCGRALAAEMNGAGTAAGSLAAGHIAVQSALIPLSALAGVSPLAAWAGEAAGIRFARLCAEHGIAFRGRGQLSASVPMGAQTVQTLMQLLQECPDADRGVIFEPRQVLGLGYRTLASLEGQAPAVTLDYSAGVLSPPLVPTDDDQNTVNDVTVTRTGGSSARQVLESGPMSVQPPPGGAGTYDTQLTLNLAADSQAVQAAAWILHLGTVDEPRYPQIVIDLANTALDPAVLWAAQDADLGDYLSITSTPQWIPPGGARQLAQGLTETLSLKGWAITWQGVPESPYETMLSDDPVYGRADTDGSELAFGAGTTDTVLTVTTTGPSGILWTTNPADFPFDIEVGGERMTVTAISAPL